MSVDPEQSKHFAKKEALEKILKDLERRGLVNERTGSYYLTTAGKEAEEAPEIKAQLAAGRR